MGADSKPIIEDISPKTFEEAIKRADVVQTVTRELLEPKNKEAEEKKVPEGHVVRTLSFRDRNLIVGACKFYVQGEKGKYKGQFKVDRVSKLLCFEETLDYFNMVNDSQAENLFKWQEQRQAYVSWRSMKGGMVKVEEFVKQFPDLDLDECPPKPPIRQPELSDDEQRGKPREFHIPSKLDVFIQDALRDMEWNPDWSEYVVELLTKYGISPED